MLYKINELSKTNKGFTLVELMTVLVILGVIMAIGVPRYTKIQAKAEYDADEVTIRSLVKEVEIYAVRNNDYSSKSIKWLTNQKIINDVALNRKNDGSNKSIKNADKKTISQVAGDASFEFDELGFVKETSVKQVIRKLIGDSPY